MTLTLTLTLTLTQTPTLILILALTLTLTLTSTLIRVEDGALAFDYVLIETSGLADVGPILQVLLTLTLAHTAGAANPDPHPSCRC